MTLTLILISIITLLMIVITVNHVRGVAICMDNACQHNKRICCKHCLYKGACELACDYKGKCDWRDYQ